MNMNADMEKQSFRDLSTRLHRPRGTRLAPVRSALVRGVLLCCTFAPLLAAHAQPAAPATMAPAGATAQPGADVMVALRLMNAAAILRLSEEELSGAKHTDPEVRAFYVETARLYDENEAVRRVGLMLERQVSAEYLREIAAFAATTAGQSVGRIIQTYDERDALVAALNRLPPAELAAANRLFTSPAMRSWQQALASPQLRQISAAYGSELACRHAHATRPAMYARLQGAGRCPGTP